MPDIDLGGAIWRKSTRSSGDGACVEVATLHNVAAVRDSKNPAGPALTVDSTHWAAFTAGIRSGDLA